MIEVNLGMSLEEFQELINEMGVYELKGLLSALKDLHERVNAFGTVGVIALMVKQLECADEEHSDEASVLH